MGLVSVFKAVGGLCGFYSVTVFHRGNVLYAFKNNNNNKKKKVTLLSNVYECLTGKLLLSDPDPSTIFTQCDENVVVFDTELGYIPC